MSNTYTSTMKMASLLTDIRILTILERLDFRLGFGDGTVAEVCMNHHFPVELFMEIANISMDPEYMPDLSRFDRADLAKIEDYIRSSHRYYSEHAVPHLHNLIHQMLTESGSAFAEPLNRFFDELVEKLDSHFEYEEKFFSGSGCAEEDGGEDHFQFLEKLDDLKNIVIKYLPDSGNNATRYRMLSHLLAIEADMRNHIRIEEKLFSPLLSRYSDSGDKPDTDRHSDSGVLSQREKEILASVAQGKTNKEIADEHFISINTVVTHRKNIARKTGINSIAGLTVYAILNHIIEI